MTIDLDWWFVMKWIVETQPQGPPQSSFTSLPYHLCIQTTKFHRLCLVNISFAHVPFFFFYILSFDFLKHSRSSKIKMILLKKTTHTHTQTYIQKFPSHLYPIHTILQPPPHTQVTTFISFLYIFPVFPYENTH